jgi:hypothetical protein
LDLAKAAYRARHPELADDKLNAGVSSALAIELRDVATAFE